MLLTASQLSAHHSDADFDPDQLITLQGVVTTFRWVNPHIWIYLDVKDAATGKIAMWSAERRVESGRSGQDHGVQGEESLAQLCAWVRTDTRRWPTIHHRP
jgi:hypothetical protein